ncbi:hypothetical protein A3A93_00310 [Candidatus Roizmanbacteria bacterium RIFCSPLOWO2_01_FULL_38_12]|uniref:CBU-0592-like domain-containing protein n=1 Tax=Candidatus Roizmanbacteria bacterium RIFCSPLOWO2_01_FULL_38_12 TaxID=1802061 RepID=A0A1F7IUE4_9BACT|nr:MAG: hypothetical protein A2861_00855 [Candidatus Roizmanbacteria bacterium RIFCSPHIGHO2_01_FULL_38_15]OGK34708.1 MAG: hypothetical protein A3F59_01130 [Candidatus Roizmanbacteria bacterium RIFCSPHIGHO2_12_FULL_38_13]OGK46984.1 MAG: hypothetical protein A3A93_00310 [Candidatus Roizmanbacteria bacterium RIFCSPLOWO2_01_FULL_38_12]
MKQRVIEIIGWYGTIAIVGAYALVSFSFIQSNSILYQLLNLTGAIGIALISLYKKAYQPGVLNIIWTIIALVAIIKIILNY